MHAKLLLQAALSGIAIAQNVPSLAQALASQNSSLSVLNGLLQQNPDLTTALGSAQNITILAPSDNALNALLNSSSAAMMLGQPGFVQALLSYHVLNGTHQASSFTNSSMFLRTLLTNQTYANITGGQRVEAKVVNGNVTFFSALKQNVTVTTANVNFTGGTIHIINGVLSVPQNITNTARAANLTALAGAVRATGLESTVGSLRDITVFAPNNDAFGAIGNLISNLSVSDLTNILGYHVVTGSVAYSSGLSNTTLKASNGGDLHITVQGGSVFVNAARVTVPDVLVSNGVVHVIDQVLNPNSTGTANPSATSATPAFSGASSASGVPFTSGIAAPSSTAPVATSAGGAKSSSSTGLAPAPMKTGMVGAAALFGAGAVFANL